MHLTLIRSGVPANRSEPPGVLQNKFQEETTSRVPLIMKAIFSISLILLLSSPFHTVAAEDENKVTEVQIAKIDSAPHANVEIARERVFKIDLALVTDLVWSVREGHGIVRIRLPARANTAPVPKPLSTQVWILKPDGASHAALSKPQAFEVSMSGGTTPHLIYSFDEAASTKAVAVVVQLEEDFFVRSLISPTKLAGQDAVTKDQRKSE